MDDNLKLWDAVQETDPKHTKKANVKGNRLTAIKPQYQVLKATEQWGSYGDKWGFKNIELDYSLIGHEFYNNKTEGSYPNVKVVGKEKSTLGIVVFKAIFFYPNGEFPAINSISIFTNNERSKIDDDFAKKIETDSLTKCLSKLGFNADVFMGRFDDMRYVDEMDIKHGNKAPKKTKEQLIADAVNEMKKCDTIGRLQQCWTKYQVYQTEQTFIDAKETMKTKLSK